MSGLSRLRKIFFQAAGLAVVAALVSWFAIGARASGEMLFAEIDPQDGWPGGSSDGYSLAGLLDGLTSEDRLETLADRLAYAQTMVDEEIGVGASEPPAGHAVLNAIDAETIESGGLWSWQVLPSGLIYRSYLAGQKESRFASTWVCERDWGWIWDITMGGRVGIVRYGNQDPLRPAGFQIDMEGSAFPRLDLESQEDVIATDFRFGMPITFGGRRFQTKLAVYHLSSHLGDEYMIRLRSLDRLNYSRNVVVWGNSFYWTDELRLYAEAGWAFYAVGGSEPWEFQFGAEYAPSAPTGLRPVPFLAINTHLREEVDFGGNLVLQTGWAWRGVAGQLFRAGMQYYTGKSDQYEFYHRFEDKIGFGLWYDY